MEIWAYIGNKLSYLFSSKILCKNDKKIYKIKNIYNNKNTQCIHETQSKIKKLKNMSWLTFNFTNLE